VAPRSKRCPSRINCPHLPPAAEFFSKTETLYPFFARYIAVAMPPIPAPIITADFFQSFLTLLVNISEFELKT
jgi:hypothetical protein